jgi:hypothetical protein
VQPIVSGNRIQFTRHVFLSWRGQNTGKVLDGEFIGYLNADSTQIIGRWTFFYRDASLGHPDDARVFYTDETMHLPSGISSVPASNYLGGAKKSASVLDWRAAAGVGDPLSYLNGYPLFMEKTPMVLVGTSSARVNLTFELQADSFIDGDDVWSLVTYDDSIPSLDTTPNHEDWVFRGHLKGDGSIAGECLLGWAHVFMNIGAIQDAALYYEMDFTPTDLPYVEYQSPEGTGPPGF